MIGSPVLWRWGVTVSGQDDFDVHVDRSLHRLVEVIDLEPDKDPVTVRPVVTISDGAVIMGDLEGVKLENEMSIRNETLVNGTAVVAVTAE